MAEALVIAEKVSNLGLLPVVLLWGYASYRGWWMWSREVAKADAVWAARLDAERVDKLEWKAVALNAHGLAEIGVVVLKHQNQGLRGEQAS